MQKKTQAKQLPHGIVLTDVIVHLYFTIALNEKKPKLL